jgi:GT2 family glycosyltransferase
VVVLDLDGGEMLERCLRSLDSQNEPFSRVIIFDNGSERPVSARVDRSLYKTPVEIIESTFNVGFAAGMNSALSHVEEPYVALVNNDVELDPAWLSTLRSDLESNARCAGAQPVIRSVSGKVDGAGIDIGDGTMRQTGYGDDLDRADSYPKEPWGISATAALYRTAALRNRGPEVFEEVLFAYYEDVALCAALRADGWTFLLEPLPLATHLGSASELRIPSSFFRVRNRYVVHRLYRDVGQITALLREDGARIARSLSVGKMAAAITTLRGVVAGLTTPL